MIPRFHTSKPNTWIQPRQKRWQDWKHGKIEPMDEQKTDWTPAWLGFIGAILMFLAFAYAAGPVGA